MFGISQVLQCFNNDGADFYDNLGNFGRYSHIVQLVTSLSSH